tara:strand:+ start:668 stop:925 length:258 start_codon:yes stop_codon:yes gene_type:complete
MDAMYAIQQKKLKRQRLVAMPNIFITLDYSATVAGCAVLSVSASTAALVLPPPPTSMQPTIDIAIISSAQMFLNLFIVGPLIFLQ